MPDHKAIYNQEAKNYDRLIRREDYQGNILKTIRQAVSVDGIDVIDLGAGTGRLACLLSPFAGSVTACDSSSAMLEVAKEHLKTLGKENWQARVADHRKLPAGDDSFDLAISGWSICYLVDWNREDWKKELVRGLSEMERVVKPGGKLIIIETQGTGFETPHPPAQLIEYFKYLDEHNFSSTWFRTDYKFQNKSEAHELTTFFFGEDLARQFDSAILPECTGMWWKTKQ